MLNRMFWIGLSLALWAAMAFATVMSITPEDKIRQSLQEHYPQAKIDAVVMSPFTPFYQVSTGAFVFYVTPDGRYLMQGEVIDLQNKKKNLTEMARQGARLSLLKTIDPKDAIIYTPEKPKYTVTVFTDLDCGYCLEFHKHIAEFNQLGIAIRYMAFPRQGLGSASFEKAAAVWCAADRQKAFDEAKNEEKQGTVVAATTNCTNLVAKEYHLGQEIGVTGTPTVFLEDGTMIPGFIPPAQLLEILQSKKD